ncbi:hypothetical protein [Methylomonas rhizoryzae]|uniref:hypothetical protein n=1 Tax=Methylomonas rhizoryzae TaxID=2608981 RepID=UPI0012321FBD|nr:hypothetical protein [Methylomonas rhizoryzae]
MKKQEFYITIILTIIFSFVISKPVNADGNLEKIGFCVGVFGYAMNSFALANQVGGVNIMSLQYGRAYATYAAITLKNNNKNIEIANSINQEIALHARNAKQYLDKNSGRTVNESNTCIDYVSPIFEKLSLSGFKLDDNYSESLIEFSSALAKKVRNNLGYQ